MQTTPELAEIIVKKMMIIAGVKLKKELAGKLGIKPPTISTQIKKGQIPDGWFNTLNMPIPAADEVQQTKTSISSLAYREAGMEQNQPPRTQAEDQRYNYTIPPQQFRSDIATRLSPIIEWIADETEGSPLELDEFMRSFMKKFEADNQIYRVWRSGMLAKKQGREGNKDAYQKKANG